MILNENYLQTKKDNKAFYKTVNFVLQSRVLNLGWDQNSYLVYRVGVLVQGVAKWS